MGQQLPENMRVLRLFGADQKTLQGLFSLAEKSQGIQLQHMEQGAETLLLLQAATRSGAATITVLDGWEARVREACQDALYAKGDVTLSQTTISTMIRKKSLFVCANAATSAVMEAKLGGVEGFAQVYDFGTQSHAHAKYARKIAEGSKFATKYPSQTAQQVAGQLKVAYHYSGADFIVAILIQEDDSRLVLIGEKTGYWVHRVPKGESPVLWAIDMMRRTSLQCGQASGTVFVKYGAELPAFVRVKNSVDSVEIKEEVAPPPPQQRVQEEVSVPEAPNDAGLRVFFAILLACVVAVLAVVCAHMYTGGDISSLWSGTSDYFYNVSSATLL